MTLARNFPFFSILLCLVGSVLTSVLKPKAARALTVIISGVVLVLSAFTLRYALAMDAAEPFSATLRRESRDAAAVFLGFVLPEDDKAAMALFDSTTRALEGMPPTFLVSTSGAADLLA